MPQTDKTQIQPAITSPSLSIIVPVYNGERFLPQLFDTLATQGIFEPEPRIPVELILVDDGSTDGSAEMIHKFMASHPIVRYFHQENTGQAAARNKGLDEARMDYVYMMDQDDILVPGALIPLTEKLHEDKSDILRFKFIDFKEEELEDIKNNLPKLGNILTRIVSGKQFIVETGFLKREETIWTSIINRRFLNDNGLRFDSRIRIIDDFLFNMNVMLIEPNVSICDNYGLVYIHYSNSDYHNSNHDHIWSRRQSYLPFIEEVTKIKNNRQLVSPDSDLYKWLDRVIGEHVFQYWFIALLWMPLSISDAKRGLKKHMNDGVIFPEFTYPYKDECTKPLTPLYKTLWFGMKHPIMLTPLFVLRGIIKIIINR